MSSHGCSTGTGLSPLFRRLSPGTMIRIVTDSGDMIEGTFIREVGDPYVEISVPGSMSPFQPGGVIFVDVAKIESLSFVSC